MHTHKGECIVRADNCEAAISTAGMAFSIAAPILPGESIPVFVWTKAYVRCGKALNHDYDENSPTKVLPPPGPHY